MYKKSSKLLDKLESAEFFDESQMKALHQLAFSRNRETRARVAALLGQQYDSRSEQILCHLTYDRDEVVRLEAVDSLSIGKTKASLQRLKRLCESSDPYIRFFAVQSHYDVYINIYNHDNMIDYLETVKKALEKEDSQLVKLALYKVAYICGESGAFAKMVSILINSIKDCNHSLISPALNMLNEVIEEPSHELESALKLYLSKLDKQQYELALSMITG